MATNRELIKKFRDYADLADASYAELHCVFENVDSIFSSKKWEDSDKVRLGNTRKIKIENQEKVVNTAYARAIESRFQKDIVIEKGTFKDTIKFFIERVVVRNYL